MLNISNQSTVETKGLLNHVEPQLKLTQVNGALFVLLICSVAVPQAGPGEVAAPPGGSDVMQVMQVLLCRGSQGCCHSLRGGGSTSQAMSGVNF